MKKKVALIVGALALICGIAYSGSYALFQADSEYATTYVSTPSLDIDLTSENDGEVEFKGLAPNQEVKKEMTVTNTEDTTLYTRVTIRKYWIDKEGNKVFDADAQRIRLDLGDDWAAFEDAQSPVEEENGESTILYYTQPLAAGEVSAPFMKGVITPSDLSNDDQGKRFVVEVTADAVQSVDKENAVLAQWGVLPTFEGDTLTNIER